MFVNIPIVKSKKYNEETKEVIIEKDTLKVNIDTSLLAHLKWEEEFQSSMNCDLNEYTQRIAKLHENKQLDKASMLSVLKLLYCYIHSDQVPSFKKFLSLLDIEVAGEILDILADVLDNVAKSAVSEKKF